MSKDTFDMGFSPKAGDSLQLSIPAALGRVIVERGLWRATIEVTPTGFHVTPTGFHVTPYESPRGKSRKAEAADVQWGSGGKP